MEAFQKKAAITNQFFATLTHQLQDQTSAEALRWHSKIQTLRNQSCEPRTLIGIVGATGAGKSSLINALLGEERIVPTSGMRACTAVVTEISYNDGDLPYRAEIDFISREQWESELKTLLGDILDENGKVSRDYSNSDSEAGLAYSKLRAVYPNMTRDQLVRTSIEQLMSHRSLLCLGKSENLMEKDCDVFSNKILKYIDSKEKVDNRKKSLKPSVQEFEYWPLIRVVRLYAKSPTLATGAVLVDLPGVHDSNAARAAIAKNYMKQCSAFFIVANISRAVDDKSAKNLLGQAFKQQIKLDGSFGNITFVCSKTDQISIQETLQSLDLDDQVGPLLRKIEELKASKDELELELSNLDISEEDVSTALGNATNALRIYRSLLRKAQKGEKVVEPAYLKASNKRKSKKAHKRPLKRSRIIDDDESASDTEDTMDTASDSDESVTAVAVTEKELSVDEIENKIMELDETVVAAADELRKLRQNKKTSKAQNREKANEYKQSLGQLELLCISARNEYSRDAIRKDFAAGVEEIDQELAQEEDPENFDPSQVIRDYDLVAQQLPVFCVSSCGYQKLNGRRKKDRKTAHFESSQDTEIPQLQVHCRDIAEDLQLDHLRSFLNKSELLCNSLKLWTSGNLQSGSLTETELADMDRLITADLDAFSKALLTAAGAVTTDMKAAVQKYICDMFPQAIVKAQSEAANIVQHWGDPVDRDDRANSGLYYHIYRATLRRYGYFAKKDMVHDFNRDLADPLVKRILPGWEKVFVRDLPVIFQKAVSECHDVVTNFQVKIATTMSQHNIDINGQQLLDQQLRNHIKVLRTAFENNKRSVKNAQKEINRKFIPLISEEMLLIYNDCNKEKGGTGVYHRLKALMHKGVNDLSRSMFQVCTDTIRDQLRDMIEEHAISLETEVANITRWITQDYMQLSADRTLQVLGEEKTLKDSISLSVIEHESRLVAQDAIAIQHPTETLLDTYDQRSSTADVIKMECWTNT